MYDGQLEIEFGVLGALIRHPETAGEAIAELEPEDFSEALTRRMFEAVARLHSEGAPIDRVTVINSLGEDHAEPVEAALSRSVEDLPYYCGMLKDSSRLRRLQAAALAVAEAEDIDAASEAAGRLAEITAARPGRRVLSMEDMMGGFFDRYEHKEKFLSWGFEKLDKELFVGLGDFVVIGGYPSAGKTMLSIQMAVHMASEYRVGYFSCETGEKTWTDRLMAHLSGVSLRKIKSRSCSRAEQARLTEAAQSFAGLKLDMIPAAGATVQQIKAETLNGRYQIIFVDYLQLLRSKKLTRYEQVTEISQGLATMARELGVTVIALAQLSRPEKNGEKKPKPPTMSAFRESGQIEQDADVAMIIYPESMADNHSCRILTVAKNKEGERPKLKLKFDGARQTFSIYQDDEDDEMNARSEAYQQYISERAAEQKQKLPY